MFQDLSLHQEHFLTINGALLHYLDWGGTGEAILFLPGLGDSAHIFDDIATEFTQNFRVLGLTRRGQGQSEKAASGYSTASLAQDICEFLNLLDIEQVILIGHSFAGREMTYFAGHYPQRVIKLIYLDATYDQTEESGMVVELPIAYPMIKDSDYQSLAAYRSFFQRNMFDGLWSRALEANLLNTIDLAPDGSIKADLHPYVNQALLEGEITNLDYGSLQVPILAFFAIKNKFPGLADQDETTQKSVQTWVDEFAIPYFKKLIAQFRKKAPNAHVVELPETNHYCFVQRQAEIAQTIQKFLDNRLTQD